MKVLVTGGAGFIGSHLVDALSARGDDVAVIDNLRRGRREFIAASGARLIEGDIRDPGAVEAAMEGAEAVFHLAAQSNVLGAMSDIDYSFSTNVVGTFNVLKAASRAGVRRVVFSSSREVYGEPAVVPVAETAAMAAKNPYGASKVAGEAYCRTWATLGGTECSILRFANVYGPRDRDRVIPLWLERAGAGEDLVVYGGEQLLDLVPVATVVEAMLAAAARPADDPINVGSGVGTRILDLAARIRELTGSAVEVDLQPARGAEVVRFVANVSRMRSVLGVMPPAEPLAALSALVQRPA